MTQPHHHVFNVLQDEINRALKINELLPLLLDKGVFRPEDKPKFSSKIGMKILIGYLRSKDYDTFLRFVSCICEASCDPEKQYGNVDISLVQSIETIVADFDRRHGSSHAEEISMILKSHMKEAALVTGLASMSIEEKPSIDVRDTSIAIPDLPYLEQPEKYTFNQSNSYSYRTMEQKYGFIIEGDSDSLDNITMTIGICTHGPFNIPDRYRVVTCFVFIAANAKLTKPIKLTMQHCLLMAKYEQSSSVMILHADHREMLTNDQYVFSSHFDDGRRICPLISSEYPTLSFELQDFCILCGTLEEQKDTHSKPEHDSSNDCSSPHTDESVAKRMDSVGSNEQSFEVARQASFESQQEYSEGQPALGSPRRARLKRQRSVEDGSSKRVHRDTLEYVLLLAEPKIKRLRYCVYIFVYENCPTSEEECRKQSYFLLKTKDCEFNSLVGTFTDEKVVRFSVDLMKNNGWTVRPKTTPSIVREKDLHTLKRNISGFPPKLTFDIKFDKISELTSDQCDLECSINVSGFDCSDCTECVSFSIDAPAPAEMTSADMQSLIRRFRSLPQELKQVTVGRTILLKLYQHICDWKRVGRFLGLSKCDLADIDERFHDPGRHERTFEMFRLWEQRTANPVSEAIGEALIETNEFDALSKLIDCLKILQ